MGRQISLGRWQGMRPAGEPVGDGMLLTIGIAGSSDVKGAEQATIDPHIDLASCLRR